MVFIPLHFYYCCSVRHFCGMRNSEKLAALNKLILRFTCLFNDYISYYRTLLFSEVFSIRVNILNLKTVNWFLLLVEKSMGFMKINGAYQDVDVFNRETSLYSARKTRVTRLRKVLVLHLIGHNLTAIICFQGEGLFGYM